MKRETGYSFIELLVTMLIMGFALAAMSETFVSLLRGYKQQSKVTETNIEGIIGLELLRRDIASAGYGLPWVVPLGTTYQEVATNVTAMAFNDNPGNPPRAILIGDNVGTGSGNNNIATGSDYLVIKATSLANNANNIACVRYAHLLGSGVTPTWNPSTEDLLASDRVIVISPGATAANSRSLSGPAGSVISLLQMGGVNAFADPAEARIVYGIAPADGANALRMPFNRADYYVATAPSVTIPGRCAPGTGVLVKAIVSQSSGEFNEVYPLLDCVADMQVVTRRDTTIPPDGLWDAPPINGYFAGTAQTVRDQFHEAYIYILAQEGQRDVNFTDLTSTILVGQSLVPLLGRNFNLATSGIANWENYRWKVYTLVVRPKNLR